jgi:myo-inositol 2-dehydrogenase / D-chiro-inositol 1-dehydrogenase
MRIGLIGAGRIGAFHAATLAALDGLGSLVVADTDPVRARQVAAAHGAGVLPVDALFGSRPDAVVIAAATAAHAGLVAEAARAGIPVFCEKPLAVNLAGTVAVLDAVAAAGGLLQVGFQRRFDPGYRAAREAVRAGRLGRLHTVRTVSSDAAPPPAAYVPLSGGLYRDCLIHDFDILRWVTGREVTEVYAVGANVGADFFRAAGDADTAAVLLTLEDGVVATATATRYHAAGYDVRMELAGTGEQLAVGMGPRTPLTPLEAGPSPRPAAWPGFLDRFADAYRAELAAFLRVVRGLEPNPCEGREALRALLVAEACEISRREGRPVRVAEVAAAGAVAGVDGVVA